MCAEYIYLLHALCTNGHVDEELEEEDPVEGLLPQPPRGRAEDRVRVELLLLRGERRGEEEGMMS